MNYKRIKILRSKLKRRVVSSWSQISDPNLTEILCHKKFDCLTFDLEHGIFNIKDLSQLIRVSEKNNKPALVRLPSKNLELCRQVLDSGADGIIIPNIHSSFELKKIVDLNLLPPKGKRGVGFSRSNNFGKNFKTYIKSKTSPIIIAMIENKEALKNIEKILKVKNLDCILIGPYDLSASIGSPGKFNSVKFKEAIEFIKSKCKKNKIPCGLHLIEPNYNKLKKLTKEGFNFIPYSTDAYIMNNAVEDMFKRN